MTRAAMDSDLIKARGDGLIERNTYCIVSETNWLKACQKLPSNPTATFQSPDTTSEDLPPSTPSSTSLRPPEAHYDSRCNYWRARIALRRVRLQEFRTHGSTGLATQQSVVRLVELTKAQKDGICRQGLVRPRRISRLSR